MCTTVCVNIPRPSCSLAVLLRYLMYWHGDDQWSCTCSYRNHCVCECMCVRKRGWLLFVRQSSCVLCMVVGKRCESDIKECKNEVVIYKQQYSFVWVLRWEGFSKGRHFTIMDTGWENSFLVNVWSLHCSCWWKRWRCVISSPPLVLQSYLVSLCFVLWYFCFFLP